MKAKAYIKNNSNSVYSDKNLVLTPINNNKSSKSNIDYCEQKSRIEKNMIHLWDDSKANLAGKGDLFAFVFNCLKVREGVKTKGFIEIFEILNVYGPDSRLDSWSENVGQTNRNVLLLSDKPIFTGNFKEFKDTMNYSDNYNLQGTIYLSNDKVYNYLKKFEKVFDLKTK